MTYAIISLGGKQYRVQQGQRLLVDRIAQDEGKTFHPTVLFVGGDGKSDFAPKGTQVTAKVVGSALGDKIRIGKYKKRTGYRRHAGHRAKLTQIEITAIGAARAAKAEPAEKQAAETPKPAARTASTEAPKPKAASAAKPAPKPRAAAKPRAAKPKAEPKEGTE